MCKRVVFRSHPDFSDNARALYEYMKHEDDFECCWIVENESIHNLLLRQGISSFVASTDEAFKAIGEADVIVSTSFDYADIKRRDQLYISTWHGFPFKLIGFFDSAEGPKCNFSDLRLRAVQADMLVATSKLSQILMAGTWGVDPNKVFVTGYPRVDTMLTADARVNLEKIFGHTLDGSKCILYMPTMRKGLLKDEGCVFVENIFNYSDYNPDAIDALLEKENAYIIAKLHFADIEHYDNISFELPKRMFLLDEDALGSHLLTVYDILDGFDALITDYSSIFADYVLLNKPIVFSCPDFELYRQSRGFIADDPSIFMPGPVVYNQRELLNELASVFYVDRYLVEREKKKSLFHSHRDSCSSERLCQAIREALINRPRDGAKDFANQYVEKESPLSQYTGKSRAQFFFDTGCGFNEHDSIFIDYDIKLTDSDGFVELDIECPSNALGHIRFDPDLSNRIVVKEIAAYIDDQILITVGTNGIQKGKNIYFGNNDPQIEFCRPRFTEGDIHGGSKIRVRFKPLDTVYEGSNLLFESQKESKETREEINEMKNSFSWRITKPLRIFRALKRN